MSGGQAKNRALIQLMADACGMGIVVPKNDKEAGGVVDSVVLGAAMLGRYADEASKGGGGKEGQADRLWAIMVRSAYFTFFLVPYLHCIGPDDTRRHSHSSKSF